MVGRMSKNRRFVGRDVVGLTANGAVVEQGICIWYPTAGRRLGGASQVVFVRDDSRDRRRGAKAPD